MRSLPKPGHQACAVIETGHGVAWAMYKSETSYSDSQKPQQHDPSANGKGGALLDGRLWREFP